MASSEERTALLTKFSRTFPVDFGNAITKTGSLDDGHPLYPEIDALYDGRVCSLPFYRDQEVGWVTFGGDAEELKDAIATIRAWLFPEYASEDAHSIVSPEHASGSLGRELIHVSPHGYFRWRSSSAQSNNVLQTLRRIRSLNSRRPRVTRTRIASLSELRRRFQVALATADWSSAEGAIAEIDSHDLDAALNTLQMRLRLWSGQRDYARIVGLSERKEILKLPLTDASRRAVLVSYAEIHLAELERIGDLAQARMVYDQKLHSKLAESIVAIRVAEEITAYRLIAYRAAHDQDYDVLESMRSESRDPVINFLRSTVKRDAAPEPVVLVADDKPEPVAWRHVVDFVKAEEPQALEHALDQLCSIEDLLRYSQAQSCGETLLELFTDEPISANALTRRLREQVLIRVIDVALCAAEFPQRELEQLYKDLLELWVLERSDSSYIPDGQFVLLISEGLLTLSSKHQSFVTQSIREWWGRRPVRARLSWLLEALDFLSSHALNPSGIDSLWLAGAEMIRRESLSVPQFELRLWDQLGRRLGIPDASIREFLAREELTAPEIDPLAAAKLRAIAIVTLHDRAGKMAAEMLRVRTGADVFVVSSLVADERTRLAADADLILFVWAATKHAVLRAFDGVRQKIEYVQGTGPTSIVHAAERWVASHRESKVEGHPELL
jgi:hypothetical protein